MRALKNARKPSILEWLFCAGICVLGIFLLTIHHNYAGIKESQLEVVESTPSDVGLTTITTLRSGPREILHFKVAGHPFEYDKADPSYESVKSALAGGQPVKVWFHESRLYKLSVGDREMLSYNDSERENERLDKTSPILPWAIIGLGAFGCFVNWKQLQNFKSKPRRA